LEWAVGLTQELPGWCTAWRGPHAWVESLSRFPFLVLLKRARPQGLWALGTHTRDSVQEFLSHSWYLVNVSRKA
jgi:hypothetical protein